MTNIESVDDLNYYRELFDGIWESAILRVATIELDDGTLIPNGELVFSPEPKDDNRKLLYSEGEFSIHELISSSPFDLFAKIVGGTVPTTDNAIVLDTDLDSRNSNRYFQTGLEYSRVQEDRPSTEINAVVDINLPETQGDRFSTKKKEIDDLLQRAAEPYYDNGRCQDYYFQHTFSKRAHDPKIMLFADPGVEYDLVEDQLSVVLPEALVEDFFVTVLPQRPFGQHKGRRIDVDAEDLETMNDGRLQFTHNLDLDGIEEIYLNLYLDEEWLDMIRYTPTDVGKANSRFQILDEYDQRGLMIDYLEGQEPDAFEFAVLNLLSTAGYQVQMFGEGKYNIPNWSREDSKIPYDEIDIIAYAPDGSEILFVECTNSKISKKRSLLDRSQAIAANALDSVQEYVFEKSESFPITKLTPCIATPQPPESLNDSIVKDYEDNGVVILHQDQLKKIYEASRELDGTVSVETQSYEVI